MARCVHTSERVTCAFGGSERGAGSERGQLRPGLRPSIAFFEQGGLRPPWTPYRGDGHAAPRAPRDIMIFGYSPKIMMSFRFRYFSL